MDPTVSEVDQGGCMTRLIAEVAYWGLVLILAAALAVVANAAIAAWSNPPR